MDYVFEVICSHREALLNLGFFPRNRDVLMLKGTDILPRTFFDHEFLERGVQAACGSCL